MINETEKWFDNGNYDVFKVISASDPRSNDPRSNNFLCITYLQTLAAFYKKKVKEQEVFEFSNYLYALETQEKKDTVQNVYKLIYK